MPRQQHRSTEGKRLIRDRFTCKAGNSRFVSCMFADSTNSEHFAMPMGVLVETIYGNSSKTMQLPGNVNAFVPTQPLAMTMLDSLTIHAKMRSDMRVLPLTQSYCRFLVYVYKSSPYSTSCFVYCVVSCMYTVGTFNLWPSIMST